MSLKDDDLVMVNRGGFNYKISGVELRVRGYLQDTDTLMVQENGALYQVSVATLKNNSKDLISGPTNFFLVERNGELFAAENPFRETFIPGQLATIDTSGLQASDTGFRFRYYGATGINNQEARVNFLDAQNRLIEGETVAGTGVVTRTVSQLNADSIAKVVILGSYTEFNFRDSAALTSIKWEGAAGSWARGLQPKGSRFGYELFMNCPKLQFVWGDPGYGPAPPQALDAFKDLTNCFSGCTAFNGDVSNWYVRNVVSFNSCFEAATSFNRDISPWLAYGTTAAEDLSNMFMNATSFDQPLNPWNVSNVKLFTSMFEGATAFNKPLNAWDVSGANTAAGLGTSYVFNYMFHIATSFSQDLTQWCVSNIPSEPTMFSRASGLTQSQLPVWGTCP